MEDNKYQIENYKVCVCQSAICYNCPGRMSVPKTTQIPKAIGCTSPKAIFVLPIVNFKKRSPCNTYKQIDALCELFKEAYGYNLLEQCMITWAIRCPSFEYKDYAIDYCDAILYSILRKIECKNIVFVSKWLSDIMYSKHTKRNKELLDINAYLLGYISKDTYINELRKLQL